MGPFFILGKSLNPLQCLLQDQPTQFYFIFFFFGYPILTPPIQGCNIRQRWHYCSDWTSLQVSFELLIPNIGEFEVSEKERKNKGVCVNVSLRQKKKKKKNYGNSNISPCKNIIFKKILIKKKENQNPSRYYYNSIITNLKFQHKPKYHLSRILM